MIDGYPEEHELVALSMMGVDWETTVDYLKRLWRWDNYIFVNQDEMSLSTGGWSGHEEIIEALKKSTWWKMYWYSSRRGGHYIFKRGMS
jgi:hypothetical protein